MLEKMAANTPSQVDAFKLERISDLVGLVKKRPVASAVPALEATSFSVTSNKLEEGASTGADSKFGVDGLKITNFLAPDSRLSQILQEHR
jgi:hypothetical protein